MHFWRGLLLVFMLPLAAHAQIQIGPATLPVGLQGSVYGMRVTSPCNYLAPAVNMTATGGTPPYSWSIVEGQDLPPKVKITQDGRLIDEATQAGSFPFLVRVADSLGVIAEKQYTIQVQPPPNCGPLPSTVGVPSNWNFACGGEVFFYSISGGALPPGISLNPSTGTLSGTPTQAGSYSALWRCDGNVRISLTQNLQFVISPGTLLTATPSRLDYTLGGTESETQILRLETTNVSPVQYSVQATTDSGGDWISVTGPTGSVSAAQPALVEITARATGLAAGVYTASVRILGGSSPVVVPVTLTVRRFDRQLLLSQNGVTIEIEQGAAAFTRSFFRITDEGSDPDGINWTARAETRSGGNWLEPVPAAGNTNEFRSEGEGARINPGALQPGVYYGIIEVSAAGAGNSPQQTTVTLHVRPSGQATPPLVEPSGAIFVAEQGSNSTIQRFVQIFNTSASALNFTPTATTESGGDWLKAGSGSSIGIGNSINYGPTAQAGSLPRGVYRGEIGLAFSNGTSARLRIALVVVPPGTLGVPLQPDRKRQSSCSATVTIPVFTQLGSGGPPDTGWAQPITVQVVDDCGNPVTRGSAILRINTLKEQQVPLQNFGGEWSGTWTPPADGAGSQLVVTARVTSEQGLAGESAESVSLRENLTPPPAVFDGGVVHAASFVGQPLAPGAMISIFGTNLSAANIESGGASAPSLPLGDELASTRVRIGGTVLPLLFARADQINAIIPFELGDRSTEELPLVVERTDMAAISTTVPIRLSAARPGVFPGSVLDQQFAFITTQNRAKAGDAVQVYASGLGLVDPPVATAAAAKTAPLSRAVEAVRVTVGGLDAQVLYAGLSPNYAGLFQVNFVIPAGLPAGEAELVVISGNQPSQQTKIFVQ